MNRIHRIAAWVLVIWGLHAGHALAGDGFQFTRELYDQIMRYANFLILAGVLFKFGRKPIMDFLRSQKNEIVASIERLEARKQEAEEKVKQQQAALAASQARLATITERIEAEGLQRKQQIIADAQQESQMMMQAAQSKIEGYLREASQSLRFELIDLVTDNALAKIPSVMVGDDHERLFSQWLDALDRELL